MRTLRLLALLLITAAIAAACGGDDSSAEADAAAGVRVISPRAAADLLAEPPADLVVLDVRTADEFDAGHVDGAEMLDFYRADFADRLADLDPSKPYLIYCRSGNRSGQTRAIMEDLGFTDVADVEGGVLAWDAAGLPLTTP